MFKRLAVLALVTIFAATTLQSDTPVRITITGSDTLVRLGQRWAEEFMKRHDDVIIQVSGGGSGRGIASLLNGTTDICEASRPFHEEEYELAKERGIDVFEVAVALDGIAVFVHNSNPIETITLTDLRDIYTGYITNWSEIGGPDEPIILYSRENNSGTFMYFREKVLDDEDFDPRTQSLPGTAAVVNAVSQDPNGIGYGGIAYGESIRHLMVAYTADDEPVDPTFESISEGTYPISRPLFWYTNGKPNGMIKELVNWVLSEEGQTIARETDYVPLHPEDAQANLITD